MATQTEPRKTRGRTDADLFEETRMSFGEHLEELRKALIKALTWLAIGTAIGLYFANNVIHILQRPLNQAIAKFENDQAKSKLVKDFGYVPPESDVWLATGRVPEKIFVDPAELVLGLRKVNPEFFSEFAVKPYEFTDTQFSDGSIVAIARLMTADDDPSLAGKRAAILFGWLDSDQKDLMHSIAALSHEPDAGTREKFIATLNVLADRRDLVERPEFASLFASDQSLYDKFAGAQTHPGLDAMRKELERQFDPTLNRRLNRLVINRTFLSQMPPIKMDLVPLVTWREIDVRSQSLAITEPFMIWFKAGLVTGVFLASPMIFYHLWNFVAAGLYRHEKKYVHLYLPISLGLFFSGLLLAYFFVFDPVLQFLFTFNANAGIEPQPRINDWLGFVLFLPLGFGVAFQLPLVMLFLERIGIFTVEAYLSKWRIAIMVIFVLSMFLTPADPISMLLMAVPLTFLYFFGVLLCKWMPGRNNPFADQPLPTV